MQALKLGTTIGGTISRSLDKRLSKASPAIMHMIKGILSKMQNFCKMQNKVYYEIYYLPVVQQKTA